MSKQTIESILSTSRLAHWCWWRKKWIFT